MQSNDRDRMSLWRGMQVLTIEGLAFLTTNHFYFGRSTGHDTILKNIAVAGDFFLDLIYLCELQFPIPNSQFPITHSQILEHLY
ncbi:hypothetical protein [Tychonema sp. LEGE 07203]|uniref:hypothetical protein n=1 Tax=Tychonema sp. LEGE 07203 TaxID=1828671 RepID=UPI00188132B2|nr:hypothetical protein [Tychonema sp. LEGE 07203]MBE9095300.1 hypothetical protein [Tychonema sp. LEGE 07203]